MNEFFSEISKRFLTHIISFYLEVCFSIHLTLSIRQGCKMLVYNTSKFVVYTTLHKRSYFKTKSKKKKSALYLFCKKIPVNVNKRTQKQCQTLPGWGKGDETCISYEIQYAVKRLNISIKLQRSCSYLASKACVCKLLKHFPNFRLDFKRNAFCARRHSQTQITTCFDTGKINVFMETSQRLITVDSSKTFFIEW